MLITFLGLGLGLGLLLAGGEALVQGARGLSHRLGVPPAIVGSTVVAMGTSAPELFVSVGAALQGRSAIALGNVVGSNLYNLALILGLAVAIHALSAARSAQRVDIPAMVLSTLALPLLAWDGTLSRLDGALLLCGFIVWVTMLVREGGTVDEATSGGARWLLPGLLAVLVGAHLFVVNASAVARSLGVAERIIALTVVAIGTSLPELVTSVVAAWRGDVEVALGNVVGSNVFNTLGILGLVALIAPVSTGSAGPVEYGVLLTLTLGVAASVVVSQGLSRWMAVPLLSTAALYTAQLVYTAG